MTRDELILILRAQQTALQAEGVTALFLFGSQARQEATPTSDVDVFIDYQEGFSLLELVGVRQLIEDKLGLSVDVVPRTSLAFMQENPEQDAIRVF